MLNSATILLLTGCQHYNSCDFTVKPDLSKLCSSLTLQNKTKVLGRGLNALCALLL